MANPWLRLYSEFATDPKVQMMSEPLQRRLTMLFCFRCNESLLSVTETELAFALRISLTELAETKTVFMAKGFIDEGWNLLNWMKRQFASDNSTARVRKHREKKGQANLFEQDNDVKRFGNGPEQNRSRTEHKKQGANAPGTKKPNARLGMNQFATSEEYKEQERREQLQFWRDARDAKRPIWGTVDLWVVRALDAEDAAMANNSVSSAVSV